MNEKLYPMIYKRKSFHIWMDTKKRKYFDLAFQQEELEEIEAVFQTLVPLDPGIRVAMRIGENEETTCRRGQQKVILLYSEEKDNAMANIGYLGEQLDLYLASKDIGALWFGLNKKPMEDYLGLKYVIMIGIGKVPKEKFRKDMFKAKRKGLEEIWHGEAIPGVSDIVRFAPSACNSQPWIVENKDGVLDVYRYRSPKRIGVMPQEGLVRWNHLDIGIFLCFLELCLQHEGIGFERDTYKDDKNEEKNLVASYRLGKGWK